MRKHKKKNVKPGKLIFPLVAVAAVQWKTLFVHSFARYLFPWCLEWHFSIWSAIIICINLYDLHFNWLSGCNCISLLPISTWCFCSHRKRWRVAINFFICCRVAVMHTQHTQCKMCLVSLSLCIATLHRYDSIRFIAIIAGVRSCIHCVASEAAVATSTTLAIHAPYLICISIRGGRDAARIFAVCIKTLAANGIVQLCTIWIAWATFYDCEHGVRVPTLCLANVVISFLLRMQNRKKSQTRKTSCFTCEYTEAP